MVEPFDVRECGQLDVVGVAPWALAFDQLGLVEGVDRLSEGVVVTVPDGAYGGSGVELGESFGVPDRGVLRAGIGVRDDTADHVRPAGECCHVQRVHHQVGGHR